MSGLKLLGPNGSDAVTLQNTQNVTKTVDVTDVASDVFVKGRVGTGGGLSFRNKIVDGRFDFWYEGVSQSSSGYGSDTMWNNPNSGSTKVHSQQSLVAGVDLPAIDCPSAKYFSRTVVTSVAGANNYVCKTQQIEGASSFAGKTVTLSFYAKADAAKNIGICFNQWFGSGSANILGISPQLVQLSTTWKKYSLQAQIPSMSGKTIGVINFLQLAIYFDMGSTFSVAYGLSSLGQQSGTFDIACVQLEEGTVATPFEELPMEVSKLRVNRYFRQYAPIQAFGYLVGPATFETTTIMYVLVPNTYRAAPSVTVVGDLQGEVAGGFPTFSSTSLAGSESLRLQFSASVASTVGYSTNIRAYNNAATAINLDARL